MERRLFAVAAAALLACGGSSSPVYDGGMKGTPPSGTLGSTSFTPVDAAAIRSPPTRCTIQGQAVSVSGVLIGFSGYAGLCAFARSHGFACVDIGKASARVASVLIIKAGLGSVTDVGANTYGLTGAVVDMGSEAVLTTGTATEVNASCVPVGVAPSVTGTVRIDSASEAEVTGNLALTWTGGGLSGPFDVVGCTGVAFDVCGMAAGTVVPTCSGCF